MARASFIIGLVTAIVVGMAPWFQLRMAMFLPAIAGALCGAAGILIGRRKHRPLLEAQFGLAMNLLALGAILILAILFSTFFAARFAENPASEASAEAVEKQ